MLCVTCSRDTYAISRAVATVPVGFDPQRIAFLPNGSSAYVANQLANTVSVIATATITMVAVIPALCLSRLSVTSWASFRQPAPQAGSSLPLVFVLLFSFDDVRD